MSSASERGSAAIQASVIPGHAHGTRIGPLPECSGLVMAGGEGRRMGGLDKGLLRWGNSTLAAHAAARLGQRCQPVVISANRNLEHYEALGLSTVRDLRVERAGPLAALEAGLHASADRWLVAVPCDSPLFPFDLPDRLWQSVFAPLRNGQRPPKAAYARCAGELHPAFCILDTGLAGTLTRFIDDGGRRMTDWWQAIGAQSVDFGAGCAAAFANANTPEAYQTLSASAADAPGNGLTAEVAAVTDLISSKDRPC